MLEELPNEFAAFGAVILQRFVGPFPGDEDAASGDAEVFGLVGFALAPPGGHGVPGAVGLDSVEQPYRAPGRARGDAQFGVQPVGVVAVGVGGVLTESGGLPDAFCQIFCEVSDVAAGFFGAAQDAFDVHLGAEADDVGGFGQLLTGLVPGRQWCAGVGVGEGFRAGVPDRQPLCRCRGAGHGLATTLGGRSPP